MVDLHLLELNEQKKQIKIWREALWTGFSEQAKVALDSLRHSTEPNIRRQANWVLGRWYASAGKYGIALSYFNEIVRSEPFVYSKATVALSFCYLQLREPWAIKHLIEDPTFEKPGGFDGLCLRANSTSLENHDGPFRRISILNDAYRTHHLALLDLASSTSQLSLQNLRSGSFENNRMAIADQSKPLVSVIMPAYNCATTIQMAVHSLLTQEWPNIEIVIVDDSSTDDTRQVVRNLITEHSCIRLICLPENRGAYHARNVGMAESRGTFVTVHDSDDWSHPAKIRLQLEALLEDDNIEATVSSLTRVDEDFNLLGLWMVGGTFVEVNHSSALFRRRVLLQQGYWDEVRASADSEYLWRLKSRLGDNVIQNVLPEVALSYSLVRKEALTQQTSTHVRTMYSGIRRLYREAARWWHSRGGTYLAQGELLCFPVPEGMKRLSLTTYDKVFAVDPSSDNENLSATLQRITDERADGAMAVLVWYNQPENSLTEMDACFFEWCQMNSIHIIHPGMRISTEYLVFTDEKQLKNVPDSLPIAEVSVVNCFTSIPEDEGFETSSIPDLVKVLLSTGLQPAFD